MSFENIGQKLYKEILAETIGKIKSKDYAIGHSRSADGSYVLFKLYLWKKYVAMWTIAEMRGCCAVCIYTNASVLPKYRRKGIGTIINDIAKLIAYRCNYTTMVATDLTSNKAQLKIFEKNDWTALFKFTNRKTNNEIAFYMSKL